MKKTITLLLALLFALAMVACNNGGEGGGGGGDGELDDRLIRVDGPLRGFVSQPSPHGWKHG